MAARGGHEDRPARRLGGGLRRREPGPAARRDRAGRRRPGRVLGLRVGAHPVPAPPRHLRRLDLHGVLARDVGSVGGRRPGRVPGFLSQGLRATTAIVIPASLGYLALARPIVRLLLEHGVTTPASGDLVAGVLVAFALGLFPFSLCQLLLRAFYAMQDRTPALVNIAAIASISCWTCSSSSCWTSASKASRSASRSSTRSGSPCSWAYRRRLIRLDGRRILGTIGKTAIAGSRRPRPRGSSRRPWGTLSGAATFARRRCRSSVPSRPGCSSSAWLRRCCGSRRSRWSATRSSARWRR